MLRKLLVPALALAFLPSIASAQFEAGDFEFTISGTGSAPRQTDGAFIGVQASGGYFLTKELEVGLRQSGTWLDDTRDSGNDVSWGGRTGAFADYHFDLGAFQPFVGVEGGYDYPGGRQGSGFVAPEVGLKYFVNGTTFVYGKVSYLYSTSEPSTDSQFEGLLGVGFRF